MKPDVEPKAECLSEFDDFEALRNARPVVDPTDQPVAARGFVSMISKVTRSKLKFDSDPFTAFVSDAIRKPGLHPFHPQPIPFSGHMREEVDHPLLVVRGVL